MAKMHRKSNSTKVYTTVCPLFSLETLLYLPFTKSKQTNTRNSILFHREFIYLNKPLENAPDFSRKQLHKNKSEHKYDGEHTKVGVCAMFPQKKKETM